LIIDSETPPAGAGGIFWLQAKNKLEPSSSLVKLPKKVE